MITKVFCEHGQERVNYHNTQHKHSAAQEICKTGGSYILPHCLFLSYSNASRAFEWHIRFRKKKSFPTVCGKPWFVHRSVSSPCTIILVTLPFTISGRWGRWGAAWRQRSSSGQRSGITAAAAAAWKQRGIGSGSRAVGSATAARQRWQQRGGSGDGSAVMAAQQQRGARWRQQRSGGSLAAARRGWLGGSAASAALAGWREARRQCNGGDVSTKHNNQPKEGQLLRWYGR